MSELVVRPINATDRPAWSSLFEEYRVFCGRDENAAIVEQVWGWLLDPEHEVRGVVAEADGELAGIAHFRSFARTVDGNTGLHLDDLYVASHARGKGVATRLITRLGDIARDEGAEFVRWVTAKDNATAQALYERIAEETQWITFELRPSAG